jgi:hypothetical protein
MIKFEINKYIIKKYKEYGIPADKIGSSMFVLFCLYENKINLLDSIDDKNKEDRMILLYYDLKRLGLLDKSDSEDIELFVITEKGIELVEYTKSQFYGSKNTKLNEEELNRIELELNVEEWINEYIDLFPKKLIHGKFLREDKRSIINKMKAFIQEFSYDKETILKATKLYLNEQSLNMYQFCRKAKYFISKQEGKGDISSDLSGWCEFALNNNTEEEIKNTNMKWMEE